ncbi:MAG TPA: hypothetical protein VHY22_12850 [Chthoniobacteraceae bacterium]|nr:hypothetical protein [Chthoniobacteraceae bacterium]
MIELLLLAAAIFPGIAGHAASVDLSGQIIKPGGVLSGTSSTPVAPALLYDVGFTGSGTATGNMAYLTGTNNLSGVLEMMGISPQPLVNITGKLPLNFCNKTIVNFLSDVPITSTTNGNLKISAHVVFSIDKKGFVHAKASGFSFQARTLDNKKIPFTGTFTVAPGGEFTVAPSAPENSGTATPNIVFPLGHFEWDEADVSMTPGTSRTLFFILQNDGPVTDNYTLIGAPPSPTPLPPASGKPTPKPYYTATLYDGTNNITSSVYTTSSNGYEYPGAGYSIPNFPSGGQKLIKAVVHAAPNAPSYRKDGPGQWSYVLESATAPDNSAYGVINSYTK